MVLERLINPQILEGKPFELFMLGLFWTVFATAISWYLFPNFASLLTVTFIVMLTMPFVYRVLGDEEKHYDEDWTEKTLLKAHAHTFACFMWLFVGILMGYVLWYVFAPPAVVETLFQAQASTISEINTPTGAFLANATFVKIFWHNTRILLVGIFLAFFLGAGPIFILTWNASVIATAIGNLLRNEISVLALSEGQLHWSEAASAVIFPFYRYLIHGIPEILAYIVGGLAGGIISVAVIRHHFDKKHLWRACADACTLLALSVFLLFVAAIIEVKVLASL